MQNIDSMKIPYKVKAKVLEINKKVYEKYADRLMKKVPKHMDTESGLTLRYLAEMGLQDPNVTDKDKEKLKYFIDSGLLDETEDQIDDEVAVEYEKELELTYFKAIREGILPKYLLKTLTENSIYANKNKRDSKKANGKKVNAARRNSGIKGNSN